MIWKWGKAVDNRDLRDPVMAKFAKSHPILANRLIRNNRTGCLEYHKPAGSSNNPILHYKNTAIHLRRYIWIIHKRRIPIGLEVRMVCSNGFCHSLHHMKLGRKGFAYASSQREYINRIDHKSLRSILFYRGKTLPKAVGKVFGFSDSQIRVVYGSKKPLAHTPPPNWRPSSAIERQVEDATASLSRNFYLSQATLKTALGEIRKAEVSPLYRLVVSKILEGETTQSLAPKLRRTKNAVMYTFRRGLVELHKELGHRRWIDLVSLGRIALWCKTPYSWKLKE
jgi:hypothetical protein